MRQVMAEVSADFVNQPSDRAIDRPGKWGASALMRVCGLAVPSKRRDPAGENPALMALKLCWSGVVRHRALPGRYT